MMLIKTRLAPSGIHGLGLFAAEDVARGTPVWRFQPGFDQEFSPAQMAALPGEARAQLLWFAYFDEARDVWVLSGDNSRFMNHSSQPNTGVPANTVFTGTTVALRNIAPGEELTCDYFAFDQQAAEKLGTQ